MSNYNPFPTEPSREELLRVHRAYQMLRPFSKEDNRTPEEKWWDELEEYNPFVSRHEWRAELAEDIEKQMQEYKAFVASLFADLGLTVP